MLKLLFQPTVNRPPRQKRLRQFFEDVIPEDVDDLVQKFERI